MADSDTPASDPLGQLPVGPDRADGYGTNFGVASGAGQIITNDSQGDDNIEINELPDSPQFELA